MCRLIARAPITCASNSKFLWVRSRTLSLSFQKLLFGGGFFGDLGSGQWFPLEILLYFQIQVTWGSPVAVRGILGYLITAAYCPVVPYKICASPSTVLSRAVCKKERSIRYLIYGLSGGHFVFGNASIKPVLEY
jgi:hypothetical protein